MVGWWTEQDEWSSDIWARRLRPAGTLLEHFNVANAAGEWLEGPEIEYCPLHDEYLMAYTNFYDQSFGRADVQARLVAWNGGWMGDVFTITPGVAIHVHPSIAYCAPCDEYLVTYTNSWPNGPIDLYAQRVRAADGALLDMNVVASSEGLQRTFSRAAFHPAAYGGAGGYLIAYSVYDGSPPGGFSVRYKMTHTELYDLFVNPELAISSTTGAGTSAPRVDAGETGFLVTWWECSAGVCQVRARRISAEGVALGEPGGFPVSGTYVSSVIPGTGTLAVTYAYPGLFLVLWDDLPPAGIWEIRGIFVSEQADVTLGDEFVLSGTGSHIHAPAATCSPMSDCLFAYDWWNPPSWDIAGEIVRLVVIFSDDFESGDTSAWSAAVP